MRCWRECSCSQWWTNQNGSVNIPQQRIYSVGLALGLALDVLNPGLGAQGRANRRCAVGFRVVWAAGTRFCTSCWYMVPHDAGSSEVVPLRTRPGGGTLGQRRGRRAALRKLPGGRGTSGGWCWRVGAALASWSATSVGRGGRGSAQVPVEGLTSCSRSRLETPRNHFVCCFIDGYIKLYWSLSAVIFTIAPSSDC